MTKTAKKWTPKQREGTFSMWLCLPTGMYAIAHRWSASYDPQADDRDIMVRARKRKYLDRLRAQFVPELGEDVGRADRGTDYGHRAYVRSEDLARGLARMALQVDSPGFKDLCVDNDLHSVYHRIWSAAVTLDDNSPYNRAKAPSPYAKTAGQGALWGQHLPRPEDCAEFRQHLFNGGDTCADCGCVRTKLRNGGYRYRHPKGAVRLFDQWGKPLSKPQAA